jgi:hypothetical protein
MARRSDAEVAEHGVAPTPGTQLWLKRLAYSYYAFITPIGRATRWSWRPTIASTPWSRM